jgi:hypothetical protein
LSFNLIHQLTANPKTPKNLKKYKIFETSLTQILGRFPKTIELPSFIRFLRPNVPILSQKLSSFSLLFGVLGDLGRGDAIFQENSYRNLSEFIFSSLHLIFYFFCGAEYDCQRVTQTITTVFSFGFFIWIGIGWDYIFDLIWRSGIL